MITRIVMTFMHFVFWYRYGYILTRIRRAPNSRRLHRSSCVSRSRHAYLFLVNLYVNLFRVLPCGQYINSLIAMGPCSRDGWTHAANSPSLCPTISSVILTSSYFLPLCIWKIMPTKCGNIVALRACVRIGGWRSPGFVRVMGRLRIV